MVYPLALRKAEVVASRGVVTSNHPLASNAGGEMLARGGNAVDAAVATLFVLTIIGSTTVSVFGAGFFVIRDGATGILRGAACWRADGTPIGISGGPAFIAGPSLPGLA